MPLMIPAHRLPGKHNIFIASVAFFIPVMFIALRSEWDYDEAWSYLGIMNSGYKDILLYKQFKLANNHAVNSAYFHLLQGLGLKAEILYRLLSLLSYAGYCVFISKLLKQAAYKPGNLSYLVLFLMPYMWYFSLGRGYGLALAAFAASLYYYKSFESSKDLKQLLYFVLCGSIASLSLFSFAFPFIAMLALLVAGHFRQFLSPRPVLVLLIPLPVIAYVFFMGKVVNDYDLAIVGGNSLIKNGAISSLISYMSLSELVPQNTYLLLKVAICASMLPAVFVLIKRKVLYTEHTIMFMTIAVMVLSHICFGSKYPMFRGLMFLIVLLYLPFVYSNARQHLLITAHLLVLAAVGIYGTGLLMRNSIKHTSYDALAYIARSNKSIFMDNTNPNIKLYNHLYFKDSIRVVQYELDGRADTNNFHKALDTASYVICMPQVLNSAKAGQHFSKHYDFAGYSFYIRKMKP